MPAMRIKVNGAWVELPSTRGLPGDLTKAVADTLYSAIGHDHNDIYYTKSQVDTLTASTSNHDHNDIYYLKTEVDAKLSTQRSEIDTALAGKAASTHSHAAADVTSGAFDVARIPALDAAKISTGVFGLARIPTMDAAHIPDLDAAKITSGAFGAARIPSLDASKISTGTFAEARIPTMNANKITDGVLGIARIPTGSTSTTVSLGTHRHSMPGTWDFNYRKTSGVTEYLRNDPSYNAFNIGSVALNRDVVIINGTSVSAEGATWYYVYANGIGMGWLPWIGMTAI